MNSISISDIQRNLHKLDDFDIVEVIDKKRHTTKGFFLDKKYRSIVEELVKEHEAKRDAVLEEFKKVSQNVSKIDADIDILKLDEDINSDLF